MSIPPAARHYIAVVRALVLSHRLADPAQRQTFRELHALGWSVTVALPGGTADTDGALRLAPVPVSGLLVEPGQLRWQARAVRRLLNDVRPDIVHIEEEPGSPAALTAVQEADRLGVPTVIFSGQSLPRDRGFLERRRYAATLARVRGVIGGNQLAADLLASAAPEALSTTLPQSGIAVGPAPARATSAPLRLALVGRLTPERGADRLLRVCGQLMGPWMLVVAGTGPEQEGLEELGQKLGLASRTRWCGVLSRAQVQALWRETDCLVVPSRSTPTWTEQWAPVLVEAMAHEVACVVTAEGALPEIVGDAGIVVRSDEELLVALQELITTPERRARLGQAGRRRVLEQFVDAAVARGLDAFWRQVVAASPARAAS